LEVLGVNLGESPTRVLPFVQKLGIQFPILLDRDAEAKRDWKVNGVPVTFIIDRSGAIRFRIVGEADFADPSLIARIDGLLAQRPASRPMNLSQR
jgi:peroxiredoxin